MVELLIAIAGWAAAATILLAYVLLSLEKIESRSLVYQGLNIAGAAGFVVNSGYHGAIPSATLNVIWMVIGVYAVWRMLARRRLR